MLTKALLTGGMLSLLAGSIVYFGTEGAVATERDDDVRVEIDESGRAGGETGVKTTETRTRVPTVGEEERDPPKTKWLDQYLKSGKVEAEPEVEPDTTSKAKPDTEAPSDGKASDEKASDVQPEILIAPYPKSKENVEIYSKSEPRKSLTREELLRILNESSERRVTDPVRLKDMPKADRGSDYKPSNNRDKALEKGRFSESVDETYDLPSKPTDYARVLEEVRKLQVVDMRDQGLLEIVDYAIDRGDMGEAADIMTELSTPELRDAARSHIGKGLAQRGNADAAFAVIGDIEIDASAAPIRLEIIAALMATRRERATELRK